MTVSVVQVSAALATWAAGFNCGPTLPSASTTGNRIIALWVHQQFDGNSTTVAASGYAGDINFNEGHAQSSCGVMDKAAAGAAETPTLVASNTGTAPNSFGAAVLLEVSGLAASSPFVSADSGFTGAQASSVSVSSSTLLMQCSS